VAVTDDFGRIAAEIDRLALQTVDPRPLQLFAERAGLQKRAQMWRVGGAAVAVLAGVVAFFSLFAHNGFGVPEAGGVALVVFALIALAGRGDIRSKTENWLARARQVVGE
jgi:hypothetical protein